MAPAQDEGSLLLAPALEGGAVEEGRRDLQVVGQRESAQLQKRNGAMKILKARLYEVEQGKKEAEFNAIVGEKKDIAWGSQIRSYVMQPYRLIKDHRTKHEEGNVDAVLAGDLDGFVEAFLLNPGEEK